MGDLRKTPLGKLLLLQTLIGGGSPAVERIALGNPLTFGTDLARPLVSLEIPFTPKQEGTGDPSPENIRSIIPWNGLTVFGGGKNLLECEIGATKSNNGVDYVVLPNHGINCKGETDTYSSYGIDSKKIQLKAGTYAFSVSGATNVKTVFVKNSAYWFEISGSGSNAKTITADSEVYCYFMVTSGNEVDETVFVQLEVGSTASSYEEYKPITDTDIVFPSPVYGGTLDVASGVLKVEWVKIDIDGSEAWATVSGTSGGQKYYRFSVGDEGYIVSSELYCDTFKTVGITASTSNYGINAINSTSNHKAFIALRPDIEEITDSASLKVWLNEHNITAVYKLSTPQTVQLTGEQIIALVGDNTIWSDADGSMTCVYLVSSKYADEHPVGGFGFGFGSGSSDPDEPDEPDEPDDPENPDEPEEPIIDDSENNQTEGEEP